MAFAAESHPIGGVAIRAGVGIPSLNVAHFFIFGGVRFHSYLFMLNSVLSREFWVCVTRILEDNNGASEGKRQRPKSHVHPSRGIIIHQLRGRSWIRVGCLTGGDDVDVIVVPRWRRRGRTHSAISSWETQGEGLQPYGGPPSRSRRAATVAGACGDPASSRRGGDDLCPDHGRCSSLEQCSRLRRDAAHPPSSTASSSSSSCEQSSWRHPAADADPPSPAGSAAIAAVFAYDDGVCATVAAVPNQQHRCPPQKKL